MDRNLYKASFRQDKQLNWICPSCNQGLLRIKDNSFSYYERAESLRIRNHPDWDPDWVGFVYSCVFGCQNEHCGEAVASSGIGFYDWDIIEDQYGQDQQEWYPHFRPKSFSPSLNIINIPDETPDSVSGALVESFGLFFSSPPASANQVRSAVESLLTELKVKRFRVTANKKRQRLNLHQRIEQLPTKYAHYKDLLFAVK